MRPIAKQSAGTSRVTVVPVPMKAPYPANGATGLNLVRDGALAYP